MMLVSQTKLEENPMKIIETRQRSPLLIAQLTDLWEKSVRATHLFLSATEIQKIKTYIKPALNEIPHLIIAENEQNIPVAFMGIAEHMIEMLFVTPEQRGHGLGRRLIQYGIANYAIEEVAVNEQNPQAKGFYERMGFEVYKRTDHDEQGNPYPILYMKLQN
jgi:putative acetyltransferase